VVSETTTMRIATRGSALALWQAHAVRDALLARFPELDVQVQVVHTTGDRILDVPLAKIGDKGLFTKELDEALLRGDAELAVHSLKDVPTALPAGLVLAAVSEREDPRDVLLLPPGRQGSLSTLPPGARVGTSSLRRRAQLHAARPELEVIDLRGNLNTRLAKLDSGEYDAIILAAAGVKRLGWADRVSAYLEPDSWLSAVGQGALAIVAREDDPPTLERLSSLHHPATAACVTAERAFLRALEGGCQVPIAALATMDDDALSLDGLVSGLDGEQMLRDVVRGTADRAADLGSELARRLIERGAAAILDRVRAAMTVPPAAP
jgi:hydroxymethylbilane synthase